jgi:site-specific DNA-cytosine methylase
MESNILSLFDGMSCGRIALQRLGVKVGKYYASEIDKHAVGFTSKKWPDTVHLGDVTKWREWDIDWAGIDLLIAGSPCQGFSFAGKQLAFDDPRSALFFVFVEIWQHLQSVNPNAKYLLENVKMKREHEVVISRYMGVAPIEINAALVSGQNRVRLFWSNIANQPYGIFGDMACMIPQPADKGVLLRDVLEDEVEEKYYLSDAAVERILKYDSAQQSLNNKGKSKTLAAVYHKLGHDNTYIKTDKSGNVKANQDNSDMDLIACIKFGRTDEAKQIRKENMAKGKDYTPFAEKEITGLDFDKMNTLTTVGNKDNLVIQLNPSKESGGKQPYQQNRVYDIRGKSTTLLSDVSGRSPAILVPEATKKGYTEVKPGECFDLTMPDSKTRRGRLMDDKSNCLTAANFDFMQYTNDYRIRRLTPIECCRLQTVPDDYFFDENGKQLVSDTQIYRMLGNGWCVDVIVHILSYFYPLQ